VGDWASVRSTETRPDLSAVMVGGTEVALARLPDGSWSAFDNSCPHEECPLAEGDLEGDRIICYCHGSTFDIRSGAVLEGPAEEPLTMFDVRVVDGDLQVLLEP
jgi:3-phenylpropionate/trans-cinnamate dioxygenase ferredoxin component